MKDKQVPLMLTVSQECRDKLRRLAAERNMRNPNKVVGAATIAKELLLDGLENIERMEAALNPNIR